MEAAQSALRAQLGREASLAELAQLMGRTVEEVQQMRGEVAPVKITSIDDSYSDSDMAFAHGGADAEHMLVESREALPLRPDAETEQRKLLELKKLLLLEQELPSLFLLLFAALHLSLLLNS